MNIDFYLLSATNLRELQYMACLLTEKAYRLGHSIYLLTQTQEDAQLLDALLWSYRDDAWLPHQLCTATEPANIPVQIGYMQMPGQHPVADILMNTSHAIPTFYEQYQQVIELVPQQPALRQAGRERYRFYQRAGCELRMQTLEV